MASITWNKKGKNKNWRETVFAFSASMLSEWCLKVTQSEEDFFFHFLSVIGCCTWHSWARHWGCGRVRFPGREACVRSRAFFILVLLSSFVVIRLSYKVSIFSVFFFMCLLYIFCFFLREYHLCFLFISTLCLLFSLSKFLLLNHSHLFLVFVCLWTYLLVFKFSLLSFSLSICFSLFPVSFLSFHLVYIIFVSFCYMCRWYPVMHYYCFFYMSFSTLRC